jgi:SNF2 family DNA or RNA helicase
VATLHGSAQVTLRHTDSAIEMEVRQLASLPRHPNDPSQGRFGRAVDWLLELDSSAARVFARGQTVTKRIPSGDSVWVERVESIPDDQFARQRPPVALLLRPLLIPLRTIPLFGYQRAGMQWLLDHPSGILADDMGLGKTIQVIAAARELISSGVIRSVLVVVPRSLVANWERELASWAPELTCLTILPAAGDASRAWRGLLGRSHVTLTSYEQIRVPPAPLRAFRWDLVVFDEAHRIRKGDAAVTQGARKLRRARAWAMTGTPVERSAEDLATLLSILQPDRFSPSDSKSPIAQLRSRSRPLILRRTKAEVLGELPRVTDRLESVELTAAQQATYGATRAKLMSSLDPSRALRLVNELRQICDIDPRTGESSKISRALELIQEIRQLGERTVVFSYLLEPLRRLASVLDAQAVSYGFVTGEMEPETRQKSIDAFISGAADVLLLSSRIGSEGLTLTEANHVVFLNEWWNPSANAQARDRVVRIGQTRPVTVYRLRSINTIEEILDRIHAEKEWLTQVLVEGEDAAPLEVLDLVEEIKDRVRAS